MLSAVLLDRKMLQFLDALLDLVSFSPTTIDERPPQQSPGLVAAYAQGACNGGRESEPSQMYDVN